MKNYERAKIMLQDKIFILKKIAEELLIREVLDGEQVKKIVNGLPLDPLPNLSV